MALMQDKPADHEPEQEVQNKLVYLGEFAYDAVDLQIFENTYFLKYSNRIATCMTQIQTNPDPSFSHYIKINPKLVKKKKV